MVTVRIGDGTGSLDLPFFNQPWAASMYRTGMEVAVSGVAGLYKGRLQLAKQEVEILGGDEPTSSTPGASRPCTPRPRASPRARSASWCSAPSTGCRRSRTRCRPRSSRPSGSARSTARSATSTFPADERPLAAARERLKFDELFTLELGVAFRKHRVEADERRRRARSRRRAHRSPAGVDPVRAHRRAAPRDAGDRRGDGAGLVR